MSQELVNSVNKLTDETSALLQEYVKGNTVLQNSASEAASSAAAAKTSEGITIDKANVATQRAAEAKQFRDETAAVATGGTATLDPTPGKIPLANAEAKLHAGWLPVNVSALSEAIVEAIRNVNKGQYAASGFIHDGKAYVPSNITAAINEGMWTYATPQALLTNSFAMGNMAGSQVGESASPHPVMNIAGFEVHLKGINTDNAAICNKVKFPEATNGTVVSDSSGNCRGTGKPTLDLSKEVDPKYGDVAGSVNEAVARAFEGSTKNGDFRNGASHWAVYANASTSVTKGVMTVTCTSSSGGGVFQNIPVTAGVTQEIELHGVDANVSNAEIIIYDGSAFTTRLGSVRAQGLGSTTITVTPTQNTIRVYLYPTAVASSTVNASEIYVRPVAEEVVINRVDMAGLEFFKEKIGAYLYPHGMVQNKLTFVDGIATTEDTVRPITYFAVFEGDTTSRGRGWKLADLTFVQLATIMSNPEHNAWYNEAGELMQFRGRQCSFAGLGNGDWRNINPSNNSSAYPNFVLTFGDHSSTRVHPQGMRDTATTTGDPFYVVSGNSTYRTKHDTGIFGLSNTAGDGVQLGVDGECYFYVLATVPRLNQGSYHQSLNPMGAGPYWNEQTNGNARWHDAGVITAGKMQTTANCFDFRALSGDGSHIGFPTNFNNAPWGRIGGGSGRPDGKFYDAIYASGQGGVIDWRLPARDMSSKEDAAKIFQKVVNGTYRGIEKLAFTKVGTVTATGAIFDGGYVKLLSNGQRYSSHFSEWEGYILSSTLGTDLRGCYIVSNTGEVHPLGVLIIKTASDGSCYVSSTAGDVTSQFSAGGTFSIVIARTDLGVSVSGAFTMFNVAGKPSEILKVAALKNGWAGRCIPHVSTGKVKLSKKSLEPTSKLTWTTDTGATWSHTSWGIDTTLNESTSAASEANVHILTYTTFAKQTKPSTNKPVLNGSEGIGDVWAGASTDIGEGNLLIESLLGKVATNNPSPVCIKEQTLKLTAFDLLSGGSLNGGDYLAKSAHEPIGLTPPTNNSAAVKLLWKQASNNQQLTLSLPYNELVWSAGQPMPVSGSASQVYNKGKRYLILTPTGYEMLTCVTSITAVFTETFRRNAKGEWVNSMDIAYFVPLLLNSGSWGDDATFRIIDGQSTFLNINDDVCLYGADELAMPYGYSKNQAGAGKQVVGVDL
ncbi:hypothetical protein WM008_01225 [Vibrio vulnificus]|uniref:hypothetical protein n=1 Tax=Vibrio vulnificus TaxID=672 RepID=UPI0030EC8626